MYSLLLLIVLCATPLTHAEILVHCVANTKSDGKITIFGTIDPHTAKAGKWAMDVRGKAPIGFNADEVRVNVKSGLVTVEGRNSKGSFEVGYEFNEGKPLSALVAKTADGAINVYADATCTPR